MDIKNHEYAVAALGLGFLAMIGTVRAQEPAQAQQPVQAQQADAGRTDAAAPQTPRTTPSAPRGSLDRVVGSWRGVTDAAKVAFKAIDQNNDGLISKQEAIDAGKLGVGGFFFSADANGDGVLSKPEIAAARESMLRQRPLLRYVVERMLAEDVKNKGTAYAAVQEIFSTLDSNGDQQIQAVEVHQMVDAMVAGVYAQADANHDGQLSPFELNEAAIALARSSADGVFKAADANHDGAISKEEYSKAIVAPANMLFVVIDSNGDGRITPDEAKTAGRVAADQLGRLIVDEPANSMGNLLRARRASGGAAPIPQSSNPTQDPSQPVAAPTAQPR